MLLLHIWHFIFLMLFNLFLNGTFSSSLNSTLQVWSMFCVIFYPFVGRVCTSLQERYSPHFISLEMQQISVAFSQVICSLHSHKLCSLCDHTELPPVTVIRPELLEPVGGTFCFSVESFRLRLCEDSGSSKTYVAPSATFFPESNSLVF